VLYPLLSKTREPRVSFCPVYSIESQSIPVEGLGKVRERLTTMESESGLPVKAQARMPKALSDDTIAAIANRAYGPSGRVQRVQSIAGGTINDVFMLDVAGALPAVLRIAPSEASATAGPSWMTSFGLRREQAVISRLPHMADLLPSSIYVDFSRTLIDRDWVIQVLVRGRPWSDLAGDLSQHDRNQLWRQAGVLTRSIHGVQSEVFGGAGKTEDSGGASRYETGIQRSRWSEILRADAEGLVEDACHFDLESEIFDQLLAAIVKHADVLDRIETPALIHSDLGPRHIFVEPDGNRGYRICGLIDLEFGRFADPLSESLIVNMALDPPEPSFQAAFWQGYGPITIAPGKDVRALIYEAVALGWFITDLARLGRHEEIPPVAESLNLRLGHLPAR
jgi:hypothetical protein